MRLIDDINQFLDAELIPFLRATIAGFQASPYSRRFDLDVIDSPQMIGRVEGGGLSNILTLSRGWPVRMCYVYQLFETLWLTRKQRPAVLAMTLENVWDSYFFDATSSSTFYFSGIPDLVPLFLDIFDNGTHQRLIDNFGEQFCEAGGGRNLLKFELPLSLSTKVRQEVKLAFRFLVLHEMFHVVRGHGALLEKNSITECKENFNDDDAESDEYMDQAIEVDADASSLFRIVTEELPRFPLDFKPALEDLFRTIYIFISSFDLCRRSVREYEAASHPMPDVRAVCLANTVGERLLDVNLDIRPALWSCHDAAIEYCVRSFQQLGLPLGAFYVMANRMISLDGQFTSEIFAAVMIQDEISAIEQRYRRIELLNGCTFARSEWRFVPFGLTPEEFCDRVRDEALRLFSGEQLSLEDHEAHVKGRLRQLQSEISPGGHLIVINNLSLKSPFLDGDMQLKPRTRAKLTRLACRCIEVAHFIATET